MTTNRTLPPEAIRRAVDAMAPEWTVREAELAESGYLSVYHLDVTTPDGPRECVLKATPDGDRHGIDVESRILALLDGRTTIPVPAVFGAVDDREGLPTPCFLMETVGGRSLPRRDLGELPERTHAAVARAVGRHLASLHALEAVEAFGYLAAAGPAPDGGRPPATPDSIRVADPDHDWPAHLRAASEAWLDAHADTRFCDLTGRLRPAVREGIDGLSGPFRPALAHVDCSVENVLFDPDSGSVTGLLDWAFTVAAPPAYDLVCVERALAGGQWRFVPGVPDRLDVVRTALLAGYREGGEDRPGETERTVERFHAHYDAYALLHLLRAMIHFESWFDDYEVDADATERAADNYRRTVLDRLG